MRQVKTKANSTKNYLKKYSFLLPNKIADINQKNAITKSNYLRLFIKRQVSWVFCSKYG